jgi:predicted metal-dependent hydrolase
MANAKKCNNNRCSTLDRVTAERALERIARDVEPICRRFKLRYGKLGPSSDKSLYGFNRESGKVIRIRLYDLRTGKLRKHSALIATMLHELCHCRYVTHCRSYYKLLNKVTEYAKEIGIYQPNRRDGRRPS